MGMQRGRKRGRHQQFFCRRLHNVGILCKFCVPENVPQVPVSGTITELPDHVDMCGRSITRRECSCLLSNRIPIFHPGPGDPIMRILLVEDHAELSRWIGKALQDARLPVETVDNGMDADSLLHTQEYALVILDLTLPKMDGLEVLKRLRARGSRTPVLVLTARGGLNDKVQGLNLGADDYLAKPFELAELEARVKALLRRSQGSDAVNIVCGALTFDTVSRMFSYGGTALALTPREHAVLEALIVRAGRAVSKEKLFDEVFSLDDDANRDAIEIYIHRLRKKLERLDDGEGRVAITTLRGLGYLLEASGRK
jgi:two-component system response regulator TctD